jgi:hypothetical protein
MAKTAISLADIFVGHLKALEWTRCKMEKLFSKGAIVRRDIERVYEGLYLDTITSLENLIERLFLGLLTRRLFHNSSSVVPRVTFRSPLVAREVVFGGRNYVDWFPYHYTEQRAKAFFRDGAPFSYLENPDKRLLENLLYIRNAIAHKSGYSKSKFEQEVIGTTPITPREKTAAGFLRSRFRIAPVQTRYENLIADTVIIARKLCA